MLKVKLSYAALMVSVALGVNSCGGDSSDEPITVPFSLGISDAPVDNADEVLITIDKVILTPINDDDDDDDDDDDQDDKDCIDCEDEDEDLEEGDEREEIVIDTFNGQDTVSINLLNYTGKDQLTIVSEDDDIDVPIGRYKMTLIVDSSQSYVSLEGSEEHHALKVPSSKLKVGDFDLMLEATETIVGPAYTVEIDLRKSLVLRGNQRNNNGYILKPHGVRIVANTNSGHIEGDVNLFGVDGITERDDTCTGTEHTVYLFEGDQTAEGLVLADSMYEGELPIDAVLSYASTLVKLDDEDDDEINLEDEYEYELGFVPTGDSNEKDYTLVFVCDDTFDDKGIVIAQPKNQISLVTVKAGEEVELNFPLGFKDDDDDD